jgi:hypothetical protein
VFPGADVYFGPDRQTGQQEMPGFVRADGLLCPLYPYIGPGYGAVFVENLPGYGITGSRRRLRLPKENGKSERDHYKQSQGVRISAFMLICYPAATSNIQILNCDGFPTPSLLLRRKEFENFFLAPYF